MINESMMTSPIEYGNLIMAKAEALDVLIEKGIVEKETIVKIGCTDWYGEYLASRWRIEIDD